jgi:hypothetical protein
MCSTGRGFGPFIVFVLVQILFMVSGQTWTGVTSSSGTPLAVDSTLAYVPMGLDTTVTTTSAADKVLLLINSNAVTTATINVLKYTIYRGATDITGASTRDLQFLDFAVLGEALSATMTFMDSPGLGTFTYSAVCMGQGSVSVNGQIRQMAAIVVPPVYPAFSTMGVTLTTISTTTYASGGVDTVVALAYPTDKVMIFANVNMNPQGALVNAKYALFRNGVQVDAVGLQVVSSFTSGCNRAATFTYLDEPGAAGAYTYSVRGAKSATAENSFDFAQSSRDISDFAAIVFPAALAKATTASDVVIVSSTTWVTIGLAVSITPMQATDQVLITVNVNFNPAAATTSGVFTIGRDGVNVGDMVYGLQVLKSNYANEAQVATMTFLDSPGVEGTAVTYAVYVRSLGGTFYVSQNGLTRQIAVVTSSAYTNKPTRSPTTTPSSAPTLIPTCAPTTAPSSAPTFAPTKAPTAGPTLVPTAVPTIVPTCAPTLTPSVSPSTAPTAVPTAAPSQTPTLAPTTTPSAVPTAAPAAVPTSAPTLSPTATPSKHPSAEPTPMPTAAPSQLPTPIPTAAPTTSPSAVPTAAPTVEPTMSPTTLPSAPPTAVPTSAPTTGPTAGPTVGPTASPTADPTAAPTASPTADPTATPTAAPSTEPTLAPSAGPTEVPSAIPSAGPTAVPTASPSAAPTTDPTVAPTAAPTAVPTEVPSATPSALPSAVPSAVPTAVPSATPTMDPTTAPTAAPTAVPSANPTACPSEVPSTVPSANPTVAPTAAPTATPTATPTAVPSAEPTVAPSANPTASPTCGPTAGPTFGPTAAPTARPSAAPTAVPSAAPSAVPTPVPTLLPTADPTVIPTAEPTLAPSTVPSAAPSAEPTIVPTATPSAAPSTLPTADPSPVPTVAPTCEPSAGPTAAPTALPSARPTTSPSAFPTVEPTVNPTAQPSLAPSLAPTVRPTAVPTASPTAQPTVAKTLSAVLTTASVNAGSAAVNALTVTLSALPATKVTVVLSAVVTSTSAASDMVFSPAELTYLPTTPSRSAAVTLIGASAGAVTLRATLKDFAAGEYPAETLTLGSFTVLSAEAAPAVPQLKSAAFSSDGSSVLVNFDAPTNRAGYTNSFPCTTLLSFTGASAASCAWRDDSTITVYPSSTATFLSVDQSTVGVTSANGITAKCTRAFQDCANWLSSPATSVVIRAPTSPTVPKVVLSVPSTLSGCASLTVDLSASSGSGGRAWSNPSFTVTSGGVDVGALASYLNSGFTFARPTTVPSAQFPANGDYVMSVQLCNFLGACAAASRTVTVAKSTDLVPSVSIPGQQQRTVSRSASLLLTSVAYTEDCQGVKSTGKMTYSWTVSSNGVAQPALLNEGLDVTKFRLSAFRLSALTYYDVKLTATSQLSGLSASTTVSVYVQQGEVKAQIAGGTSQSIPIGGLLTVDASSSYDADVSGKTGAAAGLSFSWSCVQTAPTYSTVCPLSLSSVSTEAVQLSADVAAVGTASLLTVTVYDATRSCTAAVTVQAQDSSAPVVSITSSAQSVTKANPSDRLALTATVTVQSSCTAEWSVDEPSVLLSTALTPSSYSVSQGSTRALSLLLPANALPVRAALQFTLACGSSRSSIAVTTNGPPLPGTFAVTPVIGGIEMSDPFTFSANSWSDPDLPLTYQFGFLSASSGDELAVRGRSEVAYATSTLPAGSAAAGYAVTCTVSVFDSLGAASKVTDVVTVSPQTDVALLQSAMLDQLTASAGDNEAVKNAVAVGGAVINAVSCTDAPSCATYNREACSKVQNTCGACLDGYVGEAGDKNAMCVSVAAATTVTTEGAGSEGSSCASNADCTGWLTCNTQMSSPVCYLADKTCPELCSGRGSCSKLNTNSMKPAGECKAGDPSCEAVCTCSAGYSGAHCALTEADVAAKQVVRTQFLQSLSEVATTDDVTADTVAAMSTSLAALTQNSYELSQDSIAAANQVAATVLANAASLGSFSYEDAVGVLQAIDSAAAASVRLNASTVASTAVIMQTIAQFNALMASQLVAGQTNVEYVQDNFRINSIRQLRGFNSSLRILSPTTLLEQSAGGSASSVTIEPTGSANTNRLLSVDGGSSEEEFAVSLVTTSAATYGSAGQDFNGNPVQITVSRSSADPTRVTMVLVHNSAVVFTSMEEARTMAFNTTCTGAGDTHVETFECPLSGTVLTNECFGQAGVLTAYCPVLAPSCAVLHSDSGVANTNSSACELVSYDQHSTTCSCTVEPTVTRRRLSGELEQSGVLDAVSMSVYIGSQFKDTFSSSDDLTSAAALQRVLIVIVMFASLWAGGLLVIFSCAWRRALLKKFNDKADAHLEKKMISAQVSRSPAAVNQYLTDYVIETFPSVFSNKPFFSRLYGEVKRHHRYLTLFTAPEGESGDKQRILTGVQVLTTQTMLMFILAMLYDVQSPSDDGSCLTHIDEATCLSRKSVFDTSEAYCQWTATEYNSGVVGYTCQYQDPRFSVKVVIYLAVIVSILVAIIQTPVDGIFAILSAPVADDAKVATQDTALTRLGRRASNVARRASNAAMSVAAAAKARIVRAGYKVGMVTRKLPGSTEAAHALASASMTVIAENSRRAMQARQMVRMRNYHASGGKFGVVDSSSEDSDDSESESSDNSTESEASASVRQARRTARESKRSTRAAAATTGAVAAPQPAVSTRQQCADLLHKLSEEVHCQRRLLKPSEIEEFDAQWGLDPDGEFTPSQRSVVPCLKSTLGAEDLILKELQYVKDETAKKADKLSIASDAHTGLEILHLFIKDLLGRDTPAAIIFETKSEEDFKHTKVVTKTMKRLAVLALMCVNAFFVYYAMLTGYRKGHAWQEIFLLACIIQFVVEIFLFETMECVWINCCIPVLVSSEVRRVCHSITEAVRHLCVDTVADPRIFLNAPDYLFVSINIAKKFPDLMESILIQAYASHLPGEIARKWQVGAVARTHRHQRLHSVSAVGFMVGLLQYLGTAPFVMHRIFIRFVQPFALSALVLLWQLIISDTTYIIVAAVVLGGAAAYAAYKYYQSKTLAQHELNVAPVHAVYQASPSSALTNTTDDVHIGFEPDSLHKPKWGRSRTSKAAPHNRRVRSSSNDSSSESEQEFGTEGSEEKADSGSHSEESSSAPSRPVRHVRDRSKRAVRPARGAASRATGSSEVSSLDLPTELYAKAHHSHKPTHKHAHKHARRPKHFESSASSAPQDASRTSSSDGNYSHSSTSASDDTSDGEVRSAHPV